MIKQLIFLVLVSILMACSVQKKLDRKYLGAGREQLIADFGEPLKVVDLGKGIERFIYVKESYVRETEIGTGRGTLDPRISPSFIKEETWRFDIDSNGIIIGNTYEKRHK
jgi:hypothetical protein